MKENFFTSMLGEGGKISHKRFISVICSIVLCFACTWAVVYYPNFITDTIHSLMIFIAVMSGVATVAQIVSLVKGTPQPKEPTQDAAPQDDDGSGGRPIDRNKP